MSFKHAIRGPQLSFDENTALLWSLTGFRMLGPSIFLIRD